MENKSPRPKKVFGKTEREWNEWGDEFGNVMERRAKELGEEAEDIGARAKKRIRNCGISGTCYWFGDLSIIGPFLASIIGIVLLAFGIFIMRIMNTLLQSSFVMSMADFLAANLNWFFAFSLFFGYTDYLSRRYEKSWWMVSPIAAGISTIIVAWIFAKVVEVINAVPKTEALSAISEILLSNLWGILALVIIIGYIRNFFRRFLPARKNQRRAELKQ
ncbi:MAG: hypothetical protein JW727_02970 [Candidatus Aenigmarchaeota archaeon]|nr:hypothetical protein [Candidatus Aenigmarchaeota archaeon]